MSLATAMPVILYGRISQLGARDTKSVDDQLAELRRWAARESWRIIGEYRDDGISASRYANGRGRAGWEAVVAAIRSGELRGGALLVWEFSRATRDKEVAARLEVECERHGVKIGYHGSLRDPSTADGGFGIGLDALLAARESAVTSERVRRAAEYRAAAGKPAGSVPYGYRRVIDPETGRTTGRDKHPEQAPIVAEIVRRLLARESANAIADDLNRRGIPTGTGKAWRPANLSKLALRPTYAGLRVHHGRVLDEVRATWPPIITEAEHEQLIALHRDPARDKFRNPTHARHLGTGIFRCGREGCDGRMRVVAQSTGKDGRPRGQAYNCRSCYRVSRLQEPVDLMVEKVLCAWLARPDVLAELAAGDPAAAAAADEVARLKGKLRELRDAWDADLISLDDYRDMKARTEPKIRAAQQRARARHVPSAVFEVAGPDAERKWKALDISVRRTILAAVVDVVILPAHRAGGRFDPGLVRITPRNGA